MPYYLLHTSMLTARQRGKVCKMCAGVCKILWNHLTRLKYLNINLLCAKSVRWQKKCTHSFTSRQTGREQIFVYKLYTFFDGCSALVLPLQHFTFVPSQIVLTTMKRMLNRMLRYADAIVKRGVDKLIDAIGHSPEPQTKNAETPQPQKSMDNDTDCAPQTTGNTTNRGLTERAFSLMDELCDFRYNVLDRTPEVQRRDQTDKGRVHCRGSGA